MSDSPFLKLSRPALRRMCCIGVVGVSALGLSACGSSSSTSTTTTTPKSTTTSAPSSSPSTTTPTKTTAATALVASSKAAMLAETSVHYDVAVDNIKSKSTYEITADLGATSGMQTLTSASAQGAVRVTPSDAYISGNSAGLSNFFGMPAKDIAKVGTKWVDVPSGSSQYTSLADSNTIGPIATTLYPTTKAVTLSTGIYSGVTCKILTWSQTANGTTSMLHLYVAASGDPLPIVALGTSTEVTQKITFTNWNKSVSVAAPTSTIPFSSVSGS